MNKEFKIYVNQAIKFYEVLGGDKELLGDKKEFEEKNEERNEEDENKNEEKKNRKQTTQKKDNLLIINWPKIKNIYVN